MLNVTERSTYEAVAVARYHPKSRGIAHMRDDFSRELFRLKKFRDVCSLERMAALLAAAVQEWQSVHPNVRFDFCTYPPASKKRSWYLAAELARAIAVRLDLDTCEVLEWSRKARESQGARPGALKLRRLGESIAIKPGRLQAVKGSRILLVDDLLTTGLTAQKCCEAVREGCGDVVLVAALALTAD